MKWASGDLIDIARDEKCHVVAFTANSVLKTVNKQPALVMGAGAAKRVRDYFPGVDIDLGKKIAALQAAPRSGLQLDYHIVSSKRDGIHVAAIQVKRDWRDEGDWDLTVQSLTLLSGYLAEFPHLKCSLNCPLIGLGGFASQKDKVFKMVESILGDSNIIVCVK